jgi:hypothetical protein
MKTFACFALGIGLLAGTGCTDKKAEAEEARQEAEAKARADAAKKEMETLPKVFRNRNYLEKNEPSKPAAPKSDGSTATK